LVAGDAFPVGPPRGRALLQGRQRAIDRAADIRGTHLGMARARRWFGRGKRGGEKEGDGKHGGIPGRSAKRLI
jgi:hypothetical protein